MFISGLASVRPTHMILGSMLPYFAVTVAVVGIVGWARGGVSRAVGIGSITLPILIWIQMALGHMPFPVTTAIHVPLGVVLMAHTVVLAMTAARTPRDAGDRAREGRTADRPDPPLTGRRSVPS